MYVCTYIFSLGAMVQYLLISELGVFIDYITVNNENQL